MSIDTNLWCWRTTVSPCEEIFHVTLPRSSKSYCVQGKFNYRMSKNLAHFFWVFFKFYLCTYNKWLTDAVKFKITNLPSHIHLTTKPLSVLFRLVWHGKVVLIQPHLILLENVWLFSIQEDEKTVIMKNVRTPKFDKKIVCLTNISHCTQTVTYAKIFCIKWDNF